MPEPVQPDALEPSPGHIKRGARLAVPHPSETHAAPRVDKQPPERPIKGRQTTSAGRKVPQMP